MNRYSCLMEHDHIVRAGTSHHVDAPTGLRLVCVFVARRLRRRLRSARSRPQLPGAPVAVPHSPSRRWALQVFKARGWRPSLGRRQTAQLLRAEGRQPSALKTWGPKKGRGVWGRRWDAWEVENSSGAGGTQVVAVNVA